MQSLLGRLVALAALALAPACSAPPYVFDASLRTDARCDYCGDAGVCLDFQTDPSNCGACDRTCPTLPNARGTCTRGFCGVECSGTFADCNVDPNDGCEVDVTASTIHCGACRNPCSVRPGFNQIPTCVAGQCRYACDSAHADCDGDLPTTGCETDITTSMAHCGACNRACIAPVNGTASCAMGVCTRSCNGAFTDCDGDTSTLCDTDVTSSDMHCGSCGNRCGTGTRCVNRTCVVM